MLADPTPATVKRLFAVSGNQCAVPNCRIPLVDPGGGKVTGRICHIKGQKPGSARYDPEQTDEQRRDFGNLVLMCPVHHDVIDDDPESYTVNRLQQIKHEHEASHANGEEPSDTVTAQFLQSIAGDAVVRGSVIESYQQAGGQIANSITNIGLEPVPQDQDQRNVLEQLQSVLPRYSNAARIIYQERRSHYNRERRGGRESGNLEPDLREYWRTVNELEQDVENLISRVKDEKIRKAAAVIYQIDRDMAYLMPSTWDSTSLYAGHDPGWLMVDRRRQLTLMIGKVLRGDSIANEVVEDIIHGDN